MERVIEALEAQCHENMETKKKTEEGLGIEYDEDIVCEICQSVS
jgi:protein Jade-1